MTSPRLRIRKQTPENLAEARRRIKQCVQKKNLILRLDNLGLRQLPHEVASLTWLTGLWLTDNLISEVPEFIGQLTQLQGLALWGNPIRSLPANLSRLTHLKFLSITDGTPSAANPVIGTLENLTGLALAGLGLKEFPEWITNLSNLERLSLQGNNFKYLPNSISKLSRLELLNISENDFRQLPLSLLSLTNLRFLHIDGILGIPKEIVRNADAKAILDYYFRIEGPRSQRQSLNEFKLMLVGRGGVGKTTLVHRLKEGKYREFKRTPGINITKWLLELDGDEVQANIWDLGGQEIMHGTHRFFMTERTLYLVLISGREGTEDYDVQYWLSLVRSFAGDVPIIILLNKWDDYSFELNHRLLKEKYGRDLIFVETDSRSGTGMSQLREYICQLAKRLPGLKAAWPTEWRRIKEELPLKKQSWLTFNDFREFCEKYGIDQPNDQEALADSLHNLGLMLSYRGEETLSEFGMLNPQWITKGIYQILNSPHLREAQGKFTLKALGKVLPKETYPKAVHPYLLALMQKLQLCHPLSKKGDIFLIPELLTKEEPDLQNEFPPEKCLGFEYRYDTVLPEGLLPRFIVETYFLREPKLVWRTGAILERANCRALVRGDIPGRQVVIRVTGTGKARKDLLGIIREHFERIHSSYEKLPVTELVPLPQHPEIKISYEDLIAYESAGDDLYKVVIDRTPITFSVAALLDNVDFRRVPYAESASNMQHREIVGPLSGPSLFISYSHRDKRFHDEFRAALTAFERKGELEIWDDTHIVAGQRWEEKILENLKTADIVVVL
jgi:internalin A